MKVKQKTAPKNVVTVRKHYVTFYSPGTFFTEQSTKPVEEWDTKLAIEIAKSVLERYNAKPYAFRFKTMLEAEPVPDGEGGMLKVEPKEVEATPGLFFLGGSLFTYDEVVKRDDPKEKILRSNMEGNGMWVIIQNDNSWRFTGEFGEKDVIVDENGEVTRRGDEPKLVAYRKKMDEKRLAEKGY